MPIAKTYPRCSFETQVSNYDRLHSWITASIIVFGAMLLILASQLLIEKSTRPVPPRIVPPKTPILAGDVDTEQLVDPGTEAPELATEIIDLSLFDAEALSTALARSSQIFLGTGNAPGDGDGDGRKIGPPDPPTPPLPPTPPENVMQRWEIVYELSDLETYAAQLRFFEIELGLVSRNTNDIWRIADVGRQDLVSKSSRKLESQAVYFASTNARMAWWDKQLVKSSGVESHGCDPDQAIRVHFYPPAMVKRLKTCEQNAVPANKSVDQVVQTRFRLVKTDDGFDFEVAEIKFE